MCKHQTRWMRDRTRLTAGKESADPSIACMAIKHSGYAWHHCTSSIGSCDQQAVQDAVPESTVVLRMQSLTA